ncbi:hypothetical protein ACQ4PT_065598 [Festuca glaucescens]
MGSEADAAELTGPLLAGAPATAEEAVQPWQDQITVRGIVVSAILGVLFCLITHKLNLTVGIIPSLNVAGLLLSSVPASSSASSPTPTRNQLAARRIHKIRGRRDTSVREKMGSEADAAELTGPLLAGAPTTAEEAVPPWQDQITVRGIVVSAILGVLFCLITHKLNLTVGIIPSLNVAAGLLGYFLVCTWTAALARFGIVSKPFTKQENTVIQTCVVACYSIAFSGGFGSYMLAMDQKTYELIGTDYPGNRAEDVKNPSLSWMIGFMFYFDFSPTYIGCGLICPHIVNCSTLLGAIISWGFLWPYVTTKAGDWYPADLGSNDFKGLYGYKVFISVSVILGDGIYNLIKIIYATIKEIMNARSKQERLPLVRVQDDDGSSKLSSEEKLLNEVFVKDSIPPWFSLFQVVLLL